MDIEFKFFYGLICWDFSRIELFEFVGLEFVDRYIVKFFFYVCVYGYRMSVVKLMFGLRNVYYLE